MSRVKGDVQMSFGIEPTNQGPIDARTVVDTQADLTDPESWKDKNYYVGLPVVVKEDCSLWVMKDPSLLPSLSAWIRVLEGENESDIVVVDNLTTGSAKDALSANQGKILAEEIDKLKDKSAKISWWEEKDLTDEETEE